jgi:hypothetical protein
LVAAQERENAMLYVRTFHDPGEFNGRLRDAAAADAALVMR